ncbi:MAG TPA: DUF3570 domain-containing protein, partial [Candidatus Binataceae bacterium]|nr:DUF3570 domain-containing protein [Candidatus Binataceae bacterium]
MQLKRKPAAIRRGLIAARCALLGTSRARGQALPTPATNAESNAGQIHWVFDTALAYYHENVDASKRLQDGQLLDFDLTVDSLTGSSPNGALTNNLPQTFTSPSGKPGHGYTTLPGELPVDPHFHDQRIAVAASWQCPWSRVTRWTVGAKVSDEHDFLSVTGDLSIARNFNEKNTTASLGVYDENDKLRPIGGEPVPGSDFALAEKRGNPSKNGVGALLGFTQVMNRHWLSQVNLAVDRFTGYLNDPYKILSVIDSGGVTSGYLYEKRPDSRTRESIYAENRFGWERASVDLALRYFTDSWKIHSDTARLRFRWWNPGRSQYWEPSVRWYRQSAADFYLPWVPADAASSLTYASSDSRLAAFHAMTYGLEYGTDLGKESEQPRRKLTVRLEFYRQTVDHGTPGPGPLQTL